MATPRVAEGEAWLDGIELEPSSELFMTELTAARLALPTGVTVIACRRPVAYLRGLVPAAPEACIDGGFPCRQ
jgi:hypothetical protein